MSRFHGILPFFARTLSQFAGGADGRPAPTRGLIGFPGAVVRFPQMKTGRDSMNRQALFLGIFATALLASPVLAADVASQMLSVRWGKNVFNFEDMPSGPQPPRNLS